MLKIIMKSGEVYENFLIEPISFNLLFSEIAFIISKNINIYPAIVDNSEDCYFLMKNPQYIEIFQKRIDSYMPLPFLENLQGV